MNVFFFIRNGTNAKQESNPFEEEEWDEDGGEPLVDNGEPGVPVRALYDYEGAEADELSFKQGENIYLKFKKKKLIFPLPNFNKNLSLPILNVKFLQVTYSRNLKTKMSRDGAREERTEKWDCIPLITWTWCLSNEYIN